jgi:hypothetical protein
VLQRKAIEIVSLMLVPRCIVLISYVADFGRACAFRVSYIN